jgi:hypothetical protein
MADNRPAQARRDCGARCHLVFGAFSVQPVLSNGFLRILRLGLDALFVRKRWKAVLSVSFVMRGSQVRVL